MKKEYLSSSAEETEQIGFTLADELKSHGVDSAFIALYGEMGVGKTAFVRGFGKRLDISGVKSPTYTVVNEYRGTDRVFHFDLYRIESDDDLISIGYDDYISSRGYSIAEWCENVPEALPAPRITVRILRRAEDENSRKIEIDTDGVI